MRCDAEGLAERAERVIGDAKTRDISLITAESCTAGALASLLARSPGAGDVLHGGYIMYSKSHKTIALQVSPRLIAEHSAVSPEVALGMAKGALRNSKADLAISITGVLGPEPDEEGNPVGLVYLAIANRNGFTQADKAQFEDKTRDAILASVLERALLLIEAGITAPPAEDRHTRAR
jgi:nicotinamide-nucleotide amidase